MTPDLSRRIGRAFTAGAATLVERERLQRSAARREVKTFDDLSEPDQRLLVDLETRGRP